MQQNHPSSLYGLPLTHHPKHQVAIEAYTCGTTRELSSWGVRSQSSLALWVSPAHPGWAAIRTHWNESQVSPHGAALFFPVYSFIKHLLNTYCVAGRLLGIVHSYKAWDGYSPAAHSLVQKISVNISYPVPSPPHPRILRSKNILWYFASFVAF